MLPPISDNNESFVEASRLIPTDYNQIYGCRREHNRLGFAYQLIFVRLLNRFPSQRPLEVIEEVLFSASTQLGISEEKITLYNQRQPTISEHQERIRTYLNLKRFGSEEQELLIKTLQEEASRTELTGALLSKAEQFLRDSKILQPSQDTILRLIITQKENTRKIIFEKICESLSKEQSLKIAGLLDTKNQTYSLLQFLKQPPGTPSAQSMLNLLRKLEIIENTGILSIDLSWLYNNYQRSLYRYVRRCSADRLKKLALNHRQSVIVCFLDHEYRDTIDYIVDMYDKLVSRIYKHAQHDIDSYTKEYRKTLNNSLTILKTLAETILDDQVPDDNLRKELYGKVSKERLKEEIESVRTWTSGKYSDVFNLVVQRFNYLRRFTPNILHHLQLIKDHDNKNSLFDGVALLRKLNQDNKRKLPQNPPVDFIPKKLRSLVTKNGETDKKYWECALITAVRDEIKSGNIAINFSRRFGRFNDFFISDKQWHSQRMNFFKKAGLPVEPNQVKHHLNSLLNHAYDSFLKSYSQNHYAQITDEGWELSVDSSEKLGVEQEKNLEILTQWLSKNMRTIKLPDLLIEIDNDLLYTNSFLITNRDVDNIRAVLATIMAHGCNLGTYTMSRLTEDISYKQIKHITDWQLTEEAQKEALIKIVNAIRNFDLSKIWGEGKTSSSDGQRFIMKKKSLQRTYSSRIQDYALEFYSFVADNFAPFYSTPTQCTDRDAPYVLDGLLYNESDLDIEEHYTDSHGYTEINFAAFAMLGKTFSPRIRDIKEQRIYKIDPLKDYKALSPIVLRNDRTIHTGWIEDQWDRMGQFYASLEKGHVTASMALKRLASFSGKNHFYRANRELGRVFKTIHILKYMNDPALRMSTRKGLLKGEQIHALARDVYFGHRGRINTRNFFEQKNSCSSLTLIMGCIIYWQIKEINRIINECYPIENGIDLSLLEHISPIGWDNVILYGEYVLNRKLVKT